MNRFQFHTKTRITSSHKGEIRFDECLANGAGISIERDGIRFYGDSDSVAALYQYKGNNPLIVNFIQSRSLDLWESLRSSKDRSVGIVKRMIRDKNRPIAKEVTTNVVSLLSSGTDTRFSYLLVAGKYLDIPIPKGKGQSLDLDVISLHDVPDDLNDIEREALAWFIGSLEKVVINRLRK